MVIKLLRSSKMRNATMGIVTNNFLDELGQLIKIRDFVNFFGAVNRRSGFV